MTATAQVYRMLGNENLWETAEGCHRALTDSGIPYALCGGVAVCLHGYQRNTVDIELVICSGDASVARSVLVSSGFSWDVAAVEMRSAGGIAVHFLPSGDPAGKGAEAKIPEPSGELNVESREGLLVVPLSRLIEMKLASGMGNLRRTHKDFADVVELIAIRNLDGSFARLLHKSLRPMFRKLVRHARSE